MLRHRLAVGLATTAIVAGAASCQPWGSPTGGELAMQVQWPMRTQAIPPDTAVVAVGVFREGRLVSNGTYQVGIVGRGAGAILYRGLANGDYRVVAGAFDKDARPLAGGIGTGTINVEAAPRTQVRLALTTADQAAELNPYLPEIQRYLAREPKPSNSPPPPSAPPINNPPDPNTQPARPTAPQSGQPQPTSSSAPPPTSGGGGSIPSSSDSTVTFTGGFQ